MKLLQSSLNKLIYALQLTYLSITPQLFLAFYCSKDILRIRVKTKDVFI